MSDCRVGSVPDLGYSASVAGLKTIGRALKILLDECVDSRLTASLRMFDVRTVAEQGWVGISNGQLLALAAAEFDVFVTVDRNLPFQQHLPKFAIAVILLRSKTNRIADLVTLVPELVSLIPNAKAGVVTPIGL